MSHPRSTAAGPPPAPPRKPQKPPRLPSPAEPNTAPPPAAPHAADTPQTKLLPTSGVGVLTVHARDNSTPMHRLATATGILRASPASWSLDAGLAQSPLGWLTSPSPPTSTSRLRRTARSPPRTRRRATPPTRPANSSLFAGPAASETIDTSRSLALVEKDVRRADFTQRNPPTGGVCR